MQKFDRRIPRGDRGFTRPAFAAKNEPTEHRNIIVRLDRYITLRTLRVWKDDRLFVRNTVDHDVEKAPDQSPENEDKNIGERFGKPRC